MAGSSHLGRPEGGREAMAEARGLKPGGGEQCPGCPGEACSVVRLAEGGGKAGSDGKQGRMFEGKWHCDKHGHRKRMLIAMRIRRAKGQGPRAKGQGPRPRPRPRARARARSKGGAAGCECVCAAGAGRGTFSGI